MRGSLGWATLAAGGAVLVAVANRYGVFQRVTWKEGHMEGFKMAYIEHIGTYKDIGKVFDELIQKLKEKGIEMSFDKDTFIGTWPSLSSLDRPSTQQTFVNHCACAIYCTRSRQRHVQAEVQHKASFVDVVLLSSHDLYAFCADGWCIVLCTVKSRFGG
jgi:hypothetical protein